MASNPVFGPIFQRFLQRMGGAPVTNDKQWKRANRKFVEELTAYINDLEESDSTDEEKINEYKLLENFIDETLYDIFGILSRNSLMVRELTDYMTNKVSTLYKSLETKIAGLKPPVEATISEVVPKVTARIMTPETDRTTQNTNIKTGGSITGLVDRFRQMITPSRFEINNPISEASRVKTPSLPVSEAIRVITNAIPVRPSGERPSQQSIRAGRTQVSNIGGGAPPEMYMGGGGASSNDENKEES